MSLPLLSLLDPVFQSPAGEQGGSGPSAGSARPRSGLSLPPIEDIAREVLSPQPEESTEHPPEDPQLAPVADAFVRDALAAGEAELHRQREAVDTMGIELLRQAAWRSEMLHGADPQARPPGRRRADRWRRPCSRCATRCRTSTLRARS